MMRARRGGAGWLGFYALFFLVFLYAPAILLPVFAFNDSAIVAFPLKGFTTKWFAQLWATPALHSAVANSLYVASVSAVLSTVLGVCGARTAAWYGFPMKRSLMGFIMLPLVLPEIIIAVALLVVLIQLGLGLSLNSVILGHVLICTPFSIAVLSTSFHGFDRSLEEASCDLGEGAAMTFLRVTLPLIAPGILSSLLITFTISLDEFIIAFFLTGTDATLPVYIWGQLRFVAKLPGVLALGTILLAASLALLVAAETLRRRAARRLGDPRSTGGLA